MDFPKKQSNRRDGEENNGSCSRDSNTGIMEKILLIQTSFIGDVILSTALIEQLHDRFPRVKIDLLLRKGNESLFKGHPFLGRVYVWDKKGGKYKD